MPRNMPDAAPVGNRRSAIAKPIAATPGHLPRGSFRAQRALRVMVVDVLSPNELRGYFHARTALWVMVADVLSPNHKDDHFRDIRGVIGNSFDTLTD